MHPVRDFPSTTASAAPTESSHSARRSPKRAAPALNWLRPSARAGEFQANISRDFRRFSDRPKIISIPMEEESPHQRRRRRVNVTGDSSSPTPARRDVIASALGTPISPRRAHRRHRRSVAAPARTATRFQRHTAPARAICNWYKAQLPGRAGPDSKPSSPSAQGRHAHIAMATLERGDIVLVPKPTLPDHTTVLIAARTSPRAEQDGSTFFAELGTRTATAIPSEMLIANFREPTTSA